MIKFFIKTTSTIQHVSAIPTSLTFVINAFLTLLSSTIAISVVMGVIMIVLAVLIYVSKLITKALMITLIAYCHSNRISVKHVIMVFTWKIISANLVILPVYNVTNQGVGAVQ